MTIVCAGDDAPAAVDALAALVGTGFGEVDPVTTAAVTFASPLMLLVTPELG